jgi:hypothetical protein
MAVVHVVDARQTPDAVIRPHVRLRPQPAFQSPVAIPWIESGFSVIPEGSQTIVWSGIGVETVAELAIRHDGGIRPQTEVVPMATGIIGGCRSNWVIEQPQRHCLRLDCAREQDGQQYRQRE